MSVSCQQLTDDLQHIQEMKKECDDLYIDKASTKEKLQKLFELKSLVELTYKDSCFIEVFNQKIIIRDYNSLKMFSRINNIPIYECFSMPSDKYSVVIDEDGFIDYMYIRGCKLDLAQLRNFKHLRSVYFLDCEVKDPDALRNKKNLTEIQMRYCKFEDLYFLQYLESVKWLNLTGNHQVQDLSFTEYMPDLRELVLVHTDWENAIYVEENRKIIERLRNKGVLVLT